MKRSYLAGPTPPNPHGPPTTGPSPKQSLRGFRFWGGHVLSTRGSYISPMKFHRPRRNRGLRLPKGSVHPSRGSEKQLGGICNSGPRDRMSIRILASFLASCLPWAFELECSILVSMGSLGPLFKSDARITARRSVPFS